jgi:hypothetical protein
MHTLQWLTKEREREKDGRKKRENEIQRSARDAHWVLLRLNCHEDGTWLLHYLSGLSAWFHSLMPTIDFVDVLSSLTLRANTVDSQVENDANLQINKTLQSIYVCLLESSTRSPFVW